MTTWSCACGAANDVVMRVCDLCGADRVRRPERGPDAYREAPARVLARGDPDAETRAAINALYSKWGLGRRFGEGARAPAMSVGMGPADREAAASGTPEAEGDA